MTDSYNREEPNNPDSGSIPYSYDPPTPPPSTGPDYQAYPAPQTGYSAAPAPAEPSYESTPVPYGAPDPYATAQPYPAPLPSPYAAAPYGVPPDNNLVWGILTTLLCCLPLGIPSIVYASQVNAKWAMGDYLGAQHSAKLAGQFAMWSAISAVIVYGAYLVFVFVAAASGFH